MSDIPVALRAEVVLRAGNRCECCQLSQLGQEAAFHVDHVVPRTAGADRAGKPRVGSRLMLVAKVGETQIQFSFFPS